MLKRCSDGIGLGSWGNPKVESRSPWLTRFPKEVLLFCPISWHKFVVFAWRTKMGVMSRRVLPACGYLCCFCPSLRTRSRQPVKRYKKLLTDAFPRSPVSFLSNQETCIVLSFMAFGVEASFQNCCGCASLCQIIFCLLIFT